MKGQRLGLLSLRLDAIYCAVVGIAVAIAAPAISTVVALTPAVIVALGLAVALWGTTVEWMRAALDVRVALRIVMTANVVAAVAVALVSFAAAAVLAALVILAVAIDVAGFAGSQAIALGRLRAV